MANDPLTLKLSLFIFFLPLIAFVLMAFGHRRIPRHGDWVAAGTVGLTLLLALGVFFRALGSPDPLLVNAVFDWLPVTGAINLSGGLMVDRLTAVMLVVVTLVSFLVHLFSTRYMEGDVRYGRYYCSLLLFTTSMLGLVLANNLLFLYMFWELVGLSSYLLIGHWYEKKSASNAAIKAFITTRLGDVGMFVGIMILYWKVGSLQYADIFAAVETGLVAGNLQTIAGLGIFLGAMGKSAQFPLHVWLPDAMEGPTPVSALIHAATMVAAGVYLVGRMLPVFDPGTLLFIAYTGGFTALFAASIALVQDDIKKVLAYSTVSQLGYMIMALGVGGYTSGLFHLTTHAFFKAGLFLGSGAVIHAMHHEQSLSKYGGLRRKMPVTFVCYLLSTLALCGIPPFSGFWSKDAILGDALAFSMLSGGHWFLPFAGFATAFMTAFYMFRQFFLTFTGKPRDPHAYAHAHEAPWPMLAPLVVLGVLSLASGGWNGGWFKSMNPKLEGIEQVRNFEAEGYESRFVADALAPNRGADKASGAHAVDHDAAHVAHTAHNAAMALSLLLGPLGILLGAAMYLERRSGRTLIDPGRIVDRMRPVYRLLTKKYYVDEIYHVAFVASTVAAGRLLSVFDRGVIDAAVNFVGAFGRISAFAIEIADRRVVDDIFVLGSARATARAGDILSFAQTGRVRQYLLFIVLGILVNAGLFLVVF